jgi:hypothetical protein
MRLLVSHQCALVHRKHDPDGVELHHGRQRAGGRADQIAGGHLCGADASGDRRVDRGIADVDLRGLNLRLRGEHIGLCDVALRLRLFERRLGRGLMLVQALLTREVLLRLHEIGLRALQLRLRGGKRGLILRGLDLIEQGALLDVLSALECDALQDATHLGVHVDRLDRLHVPDEFAGARDLLRMHGQGHDGRRRRARSGLLRLCRNGNADRNHEGRGKLCELEQSYESFQTPVWARVAHRRVNERPPR